MQKLAKLSLGAWPIRSCVEAFQELAAACVSGLVQVRVPGGVWIDVADNRLEVVDVVVVPYCFVEPLVHIGGDHVDY